MKKKNLLQEILEVVLLVGCLGVWFFLLGSNYERIRFENEGPMTLSEKYRTERNDEDMTVVESEDPEAMEGWDLMGDITR